MKNWIAAGLAAAMVGLAIMVMQRGESPTPQTYNPSLATLIDLETGAFAPLNAAWNLTLPADHGPHLGTQGELWSLSLWLHDADDRHFAFQASTARLALTARAVARDSAWAANQLYRAQLAASLPGEARVRTSQRLNRAALGLAGATTQPVRIWVEGWSLAASRDGSRLDLEIADGDFSVQLALTPLKIALDGRDLGLFVQRQDSPDLRAYLMTRLEVTGTLSIAGKQTDVRGGAWLDHLWGNLGVPDAAPALNRIAIQLDDGRDLLCLQLRPRSDEGTPIPTCALVLADGQVQSFQRREIRLEPTRVWQSKDTGKRYPVAWQLVIPLIDLELAIEPRIADQELDLAAPYWSGSAQIAGRQSERQLGGHGWVEVTDLDASEQPQ